MSLSNSNAIGATPRIQISLSKDQRKSMAGAATATQGKSNSVHSVIAASPGLYKSVRKALKNQSLNFKINVECTSLKVSPSGNFLWGGFSDGTLRVWDLSGTFGVEDDDVVASRQKTDVLVNSKLTQGYGAVACQIHARGVHTDLITTVDISDDAQYVFVGVARGAMELHAVFVGDLERAVHTHKQRERERNGSKNISAKRNILDYIKVYCHSDAKIKGFGACASMKVENPNSSSPSYMLLTGKGIKNIHIWKFTPPKHSTSDELMEEVHGRNRKQSICDPPDDEEDHGIWDQLYDTSTNGNTIVLLGFYRNPQNKLLAVSKSDTQKLRLWDLSFEEDSALSEATKDAQRKKRPPYKDVDNSQSTLEIAGGIGVCGGGNMYNEMSIVSLDRPDDPYNHTELALPSAAALSGGLPAQQQQFMGYSSRRQRRGEMKAVVNVATSPRDSSHALLELDDGSLVGYSAGSSSSAKDSSGSIPKLAIATPESTGIPALPADFWRRCICLANIAGVVIAASSLYNPNTNKGQLVIRALGGLKKPRGSEFKEKKKLKLLKQQQKQRERMELERLEKEGLKREREREQARQDQQLKTDATPNTPSPIHNNLQSSPMAADTNALRDAVSAPTAVPVSALRVNKKPLDSQTENIHDSKENISQSFASSAANLTRVSPNGTMETPRHQKKTPTEEDESPDSTQGLPKISKFLQPKRINLQAQQLQDQSKKRKAEHPAGIAREKSTAPETPLMGKKTTENVVVAATKTSNSQNPTFQLSNIGSIPFKSPKPQTKKQRKVGAPSKPKKSTSIPPIPFSSPDASRDVVERKRDREAAEIVNQIVTSAKIPRTSDDMSTALLLTALASPKPAATAKAITSDGIVASTPKTIALTAKTKSVIAVTPKAIAKKSSNSASKFKGKSTSVANAREEILHEKISEQYQQLRAFLKSITSRSMALIHSRNKRGPVPSALASGAAQNDATHLSAYSKLLAEHKAAHDYLQRRLLRSAETTLRLLLESAITAEEARTQLKNSIKKFEEILYDTLHRQEMERLTVVSQHHGSPTNFARSRKSGNDESEKPSESKKQNSNYPCKEAFDKVEDICAAITRPVGRPRSAIAALR